MSEMLRELVIRAREDEGECLKILESFEPLIKKCIKMYLRDFTSFEDALQEGRLAVLKCIKNYDINSPITFPGYVKMGVIYCIRDFGARFKEIMSLDDEVTEDGGRLHDILPGDVDIEEEQIRAEELDRLEAAINKLPEKQREVIEEFYFEGKSMKEMCKGRRCHYNAVVQLKDRAIKSLRGLLQD